VSDNDTGHFTGMTECREKNVWKKRVFRRLPENLHERWRQDIEW